MRRLLCTALAVLAAGAVAALGPTPVSAAPLPYLAVDCGQDVRALRGQPVVLARIAVVGLVTKAVRETPGLGLLRATALGVAFPLGLPIPVGEVPDGTVEVTGTQIADAVAAAVRPLPEIAPAADAVAARVHELVAADCGMTLRAINPSKPGTGKPAPAPNPGAGGNPAISPNAQPVGGYTSPDQLALYDGAALAGTRAPRDYGSIPFARAGLFVPSPDARYGSVPGYAPEFGILGADGADVRAAGGAQALPANGSAQVALPIMLAVLALSVVTGALVRTWVLREA
ncbi:hypothetical protein [Actinokineospora sp.]|uniref:hypothetical protein n=1 Tax=Actinokineospora sp. TaxID=1872133 RepID=UPI0040380B87